MIKKKEALGGVSKYLLFQRALRQMTLAKQSVTKISNF